MIISMMKSARGFEAMELSSSTVPDLKLEGIESDIYRPFMPTVAGKGGFDVFSVDDLLQMLSVQKESASRFFIGSNTLSFTVSTDTKSRFKDLTSRFLGWTHFGDSYDLAQSQYAQDSLNAQTAYFWFITVFSNSFAVGFGVKAALEGVHPKFHFSATMARSMEFVWVVIVYLSVPQWWHSAVLVLLDTIQNVTIWIQIGNSQGVKLVTNSCYLFCLVVKAAMCFGLVLIDPFSRDLVWGIYEILSAFTLTRISGMSFKKLGLFRGQMYTLAVFTATMLSAAQAFGHFGPFALFLFLCIYSAVHKQPQPKRKRVKKNKQSQSQSQSKPQTVNWAEEAQRNPFRGEESMVLVRSLLKEGDHLNQTATKEDRARIVFQVITGKMDAEWLSQDHLVKVLCPSGVSLSSIKTSFDELSTVNPMTNEKGIHFETFFKKLPTVWDWYFDYMYDSVYAPEKQ